MRELWKDDRHLESVHIFDERIVCTDCLAKLRPVLSNAAIPPATTSLKTVEITNAAQRWGILFSLVGTLVTGLGYLLSENSDQYHRWRETVGGFMGQIGFPTLLIGLAIFVYGRMRG